MNSEYQICAEVWETGNEASFSHFIHKNVHDRRGSTHLRLYIITYDSWSNIPCYENSKGNVPCEALTTSYSAHYS